MAPDLIYWFLVPFSGDGHHWEQVRAFATAAEGQPPAELAALLPAGIDVRLLQPGAKETTYAALPSPAKTADPAESSRSRLLRLLALVTDDATENHTLETSIGIDPTLSVGLLRLVNSVALGLPRKVSSYHQAIVILGRKQLKRWLTLLIFAEAGQGKGLLLPLSARRGRLLESLARALHPGNGALHDAAFMTGILSLADRAMGMPLPLMLPQLNLDENLVGALLNHAGPLGEFLQWAEAVDREDAQAAAADLIRWGISPEAALALQAEAIVWAEGATRES